MDRLSNGWRAFKQNPGTWSLALFEVGLLVSERCFEVLTLKQYADNGDWHWFTWMIIIIYFSAFIMGVWISWIGKSVFG